MSIIKPADVKLVDCIDAGRNGLIYYAYFLLEGCIARGHQKDFQKRNRSESFALHLCLHTFTLSR